jgi:hypothetical protein
LAVADYVDWRSDVEEVEDTRLLVGGWRLEAGRLKMDV